MDGNVLTFWLHPPNSKSTEIFTVYSNHTSKSKKYNFLSLSVGFVMFWFVSSAPTYMLHCWDHNTKKLLYAFIFICFYIYSCF